MDPSPYPEDPWANVRLPDHGETWCLESAVRERAEHRVVMGATGKVLPWRLVRSLRLGDDVRLHYEDTNVGSAPLLAYWCARPLFRGDDGASAKILHDRARLRWAGLARGGDVVGPIGHPICRRLDQRRRSGRLPPPGG